MWINPGWAKVEQIVGKAAIFAIAAFATIQLTKGYGILIGQGISYIASGFLLEPFLKYHQSTHLSICTENDCDHHLPFGWIVYCDHCTLLSTCCCPTINTPTAAYGRYSVRTGFITVRFNCSKGVTVYEFIVGSDCQVRIECIS